MSAFFFFFFGGGGGGGGGGIDSWTWNSVSYPEFRLR